MNIERFNPDEPVHRRLERKDSDLESGEGRLEDFLAQQSDVMNARLMEYQQNLGEDLKTLVDDEFRIVPPAQLRPGHEKIIAEYKRRRSEDEDNDQGYDVEGYTKPRGIVTEELIIAILYKKLGGKYLVVRTAESDDRRNGVDHLIIDAETGSVVCGMDDLSSLGTTRGDKRLDGKVREAVAKNCGIKIMPGGGIVQTEPGASVDYGINIRRQDEGVEIDPRITCGPIDHIPMFLFVLEAGDLKKCLKSFVSDPDESSEDEDKIFESFVKSALEQIDLVPKMADMVSKSRDKKISLPGDLLSRLAEFKRFLLSLNLNKKHD